MTNFLSSKIYLSVVQYIYLNSKIQKQKCLEVTLKIHDNRLVSLLNLKPFWSFVFTSKYFRVYTS